MDIHFCFPITADVTLCGELTEDEPVIMNVFNVFKVTCARCRELIDEISRQLTCVSSVPEKEASFNQD